ncbi:MlaE family lipid ABC transporter permease subunit [Afifella sp. JA880]|uniref:ABC transporter permease n=1 Tax=Afifella sp. JA880 TaxID=2975280 RepID=UPI0021BBACD9|nr:MlaE family lipid ABC transporter permease subunit [Afifella sp. JA880]MCT8267365.1 MlaE family lipid ABC transporter permease subunit [Afifella sp. JA880]
MTSDLSYELVGERFVLRPKGAWAIDQAANLDRSLQKATGDQESRARRLEIDLSDLETLDTAGAFLLVRLEKAWRESGRDVTYVGAEDGRETLIERVRVALKDGETLPHPKKSNVFADVGQTVLSIIADARRIVTMLGSVILEILHVILHPGSARFYAIINQMEMIGLRAVPIVVLMSFIIGAILAQQSAFQLRYFGAEVFSVDLLGILALREISLLLTAIMVAGRSGSAITAELGSMQMREEIDALRVMGMDPINVLILPRILALLIVLPLLSFIAALATLAGGMMMLWLYSSITPDAFIARLHDAIDMSSFLSGLYKSPFMALIIGLIACTEGMAVGGSAESLGRRTTASVVKAIFMVIVVDGLFAVFYAAIGF